MNSKQTWGN